jgi:vacuolar-type H+-ATPase subunit D/Vma8
MKAKLKGAQTGHDLLKRKSEALTKYVDDPAMQECLLTRSSTDVSEVFDPLVLN